MPSPDIKRNIKKDGISPGDQNDLMYPSLSATEITPNSFSLKIGGCGEDGSSSIEKHKVFIKKLKPKEPLEDLEEPGDYEEEDLRNRVDGIQIFRTIYGDKYLDETSMENDGISGDKVLEIKPGTLYKLFVRRYFRDGRYASSEWLEIETPSLEEQQSNFFLVLLSTLILIVAIAAALYLGLNGNQEVERKPCDTVGSNHNYRNVAEFKSYMKIMEEDFPNQNKLLWKLLTNVGKRHIKQVFEGDTRTLAPLTFHLAGYSDANETLICFVKKLADSFTCDSKWRRLNAEDFPSENDRGKFDEEIKDSLKKSNKVVIVKDLNKLTFNVAQLFMSYADEHNKVASYPQSLILITTMLPFPHESSRTRHEDEWRVGDYFLNDVWKEQDADLKKPLWARVGDGVGLVKKEERNPCTVL